MGDVVLHLPVESNEDVLFGAFVSRFMESRSTEIERCAVSSDAPYLMIRSDPALGEEMRVLIFQEDSAANAFSSGWAKARLEGQAA